MDLDYEKIRDRKPGIVDLDQYRKFAVGIPLIDTAEGIQILFEVRARRIRTQPGDICLPGGAVEKGETPKQAAVRELSEELLLPPEKIELIGAGDLLITGKESAIYPYIVRLHDYAGSFQESEVEEIFTVPLSFFLETDPRGGYTTIREVPEDDFPFDRIQNGRDYRWLVARKRIVFYQYEDRTIWGMTGKVMESFVKLLKQIREDGAPACADRSAVIK